MGGIDGGTWRSAGWFGVLVAAVGVLGFLPGALVFFLTFLRRKAQQSWGSTLALTACVIVALAAAANLLSRQKYPNVIAVLQT